jgi:hypothetical protein
MRRFLKLTTVLLVATGAVRSLHAAPQVAAVPSIMSTPSVLCVLPHCDGPYCRASNGCLVCCTH